MAIQPASLSSLLRGYLSQVFAPLAVVLVPVVNRICTWRDSYPLDPAFLLKYAGNINVPVLYIQAREDPCGSSQELQPRSPRGSASYFVTSRDNLSLR